ncbi:MAG: hypothetical protein Q9195_009107 [Heterodermia aff. obscurata]
MSDSDNDELMSSQLSEAARAGDLSEIQTLIKRLPPSNSTEKSLQPALFVAIGQGHVSVVSYLMDHGAKFHADMANPALSCTNAEDIFRLALGHGWDINSRTTIGLPVFAVVIQSQSLPLTRWFLTHGAEATLRGSRAGVSGAHMLDVAAACSSIQVLDLLIEYGLKLEDSDALHSVASAIDGPPGRLDMMAHLLTLGMDINAIEKVGAPESRGIGRGSPLHSAAYVEMEEHVVFLLEKGADKTIKNTLGQNVTDFARAQEAWKVVDLLSKYP